MAAESKVEQFTLQRKVAVAGVILLTCTTALDVARRWRKKGQQLPSPPGYWPVLGHFVTCMRYCWDNTSLALARWGVDLYRTEGLTIYRANFLGHEIVCIADPDLVQEVFEQDPHRFTKDFANAPLGGDLLEYSFKDGLFTAATDDPKWQVAHRVLIQPFSVRGVRGIMPLMCDQADQLIKAMKRDVGYGNSTYIDTWVTKMAFETIAVCGLGTSFGCLEDDQTHPFVTALNQEKRQQSDFLKLKNALSGKIKAMKQDLESTKKALADATATKANAEGEVAVCEQDIKTAKEFLVQVERGCMEKAGQFQQQKKNREDEVKAIMGALKALRGVMTSKRSKQSALSFLQLSSGRSKELHHLALRKVQQLAVAMQSPALNQLASKMTALARYGGEDVFVKMRKLIQEMISALEQTNREEMGKKAFCDQEMKHTKATLSDRQDESKRKSAALELTTAQVVESLDPLGRWPSFLRPIFCRKLLKSYIESAGRLRQTCLEILRKRKSEEQKDLNKDLLDRMLLDADPKTGQTMCEDSIVDNLLTFLFAGQDSTAAAMASCLCFLCSNPGCKERLLREIDEVVGDEAVSYEHLSQLQYLDWCIKETLRLMPPAAGALRDSTCEQVLGGWHIPAKAAIVVNTMTLHYRADLWGADVDQFKPERWEKGLPHKFAFMPFSHGPRACIGREFTLLEQKVTLVKFFQNLDIEQAPAEETAGYATLKADGRSPPFLKFDTQVKRDSAFLGLYTNFKLLPRTRAKDAVASH